MLVWVLPLPALLALLTPRLRKERSDPAELERAVALTGLVLRRHPLVRATCLVRSLVLYRLLRGRGVPATIVFGVRRSVAGLEGHAWLSGTGGIVGAEPDAGEAFTAVYAYPSAARGGCSLRKERDALERA